jgi:pentatricopeptide repeat protein
VAHYRSLQEVFDGTEFRNVVIWNALISGYVQHGRNEKTLSFFDHVRLEGSFPDAVALICSLKACNVHKGIAIHDEIAKHDMVGGNIPLDTTLVTIDSN